MMKKILGIIFTVIAVGGLFFSVFVKIPYEPCCSCPANDHWPGLGISALIYQHKMKTTECGECVDTIQGSYSSGCVDSYYVVPIDFIILSMLIGLGGIILIRRNNHPANLEKPKEE